MHFIFWFKKQTFLLKYVYLRIIQMYMCTCTQERDRFGSQLLYSYDILTLRVVEDGFYSGQYFGKNFNLWTCYYCCVCVVVLNVTAIQPFNKFDSEGSEMILRLHSSDHGQKQCMHIVVNHLCFSYRKCFYKNCFLFLQKCFRIGVIKFQVSVYYSYHVRACTGIYGQAKHITTSAG